MTDNYLCYYSLTSTDTELLGYSETSVVNWLNTVQRQKHLSTSSRPQWGMVGWRPFEHVDGRSKKSDFVRTDCLIEFDQDML
jgi:hypothetical protein